jgi:hypothetical protein
MPWASINDVEMKHHPFESSSLEGESGQLHASTAYFKHISERLSGSQDNSLYQGYKRFQLYCRESNLGRPASKKYIY